MRTDTCCMNFSRLRLKAVLFAMGGALALYVAASALAQSASVPFVRLAELHVDAARLKDFEAAASTHIAAATRIEPGILAFHMVAEQGQPTRI